MTGDYLARVTGAAAPVGGLEGKIIKVDGTRAWINLGASSGIKVGDHFNIISIGEALIDPDTGKKLGADEHQTGSGAVVEVQPEFAIMSFTGKAIAKDTSANRSGIALRLRSIAGHRRGQEFVFSGPRVRIGRSRDNDLILPDRDRPVSSSHHAEALLDASGAWWIVDTDSSNGTRVNDVVVARHRLQNGERLTLGDEQFVVALAGERAWRLFGISAVAVVLGLIAIYEVVERRSAPFEGVAAVAAHSVFLIAIDEGNTRSIVGTGFAVGADGRIATNAHVAAELERRGAVSAAPAGARALAVQGDDVRSAPDRIVPRSRPIGGRGVCERMSRFCGSMTVRRSFHSRSPTRPFWREPFEGRRLRRLVSRPSPRMRHIRAAVCRST